MENLEGFDYCFDDFLLSPRKRRENLMFLGHYYIN